MKNVDLETELNIVDTIKSGEIDGDVPKDAAYAQLSLNGGFIQKFYKFDNVKLNDGTVKKVMYYWGEQGGWHGSSYNYEDIKGLKKANFLKIV